MTQLDRVEEKLDRLLENLDHPRTKLLDTKGLGQKLNRSYPVAREIIKKRIFPSPVQFLINDRAVVNERLLDEWLEVPENLEKLNRL